MMSSCLDRCVVERLAIAGLRFAVRTRIGGIEFRANLVRGVADAGPQFTCAPCGPQIEIVIGDFARQLDFLREATGIGLWRARRRDLDLFAVGCVVVGVVIVVVLRKGR